MVKKEGLYASYYVCSVSVSFDSFALKWVHNTQVRLTWSVYWLPLPPSKTVKPMNVPSKTFFIVGTAQLCWQPYTLLKIAEPCHAMSVHFRKACQSAQHGTAQHDTARHSWRSYLQNNQCRVVPFSAGTLYFTSVNVVLEVGLCRELISLTYV